MTNTLDGLFSGLAPSTNQAAAAAIAAKITQVPLALPLMDFQIDAVNHALRDSMSKPYAYLALDMGLGKTPCAWAIFAAAHAAGVGPSVAVVPPSVRINWVREAKRFTPHLRVATLQGDGPEAGKGLPDADVYIIGSSSLAAKGYRVPKSGPRPDPLDQLSKWARLLVTKVTNIVVDEAHFFKNKSARSRALKALAVPLTGLRILMSGTPTPNGRHAELATQIDVLGNKAWRDIGGEGMFWHHYAPMQDAYGGRGTNDADGLFKAMSATWYYRRLRDDVLELPNKGRSALSVEARGRGVKSYLAVEDDLIAWLAQEGRNTKGAERAEALVRLTTLRKLAGEVKIAGVADHVMDILNETPGGVFVVAEHSDVIDGLLMRFARYNPTVVQGGMSDNEKQWHIDQFTSGKSRVLIGQIIAAGTGLTLHGGGINHRVVVAQLPWTPADLRQAEDRLHRIGQTRDVHVEIALAAIEGRWTIDERLWGMLEQKYFNASTITDGEGEWLLGEAVEGILDSYRT